MATPPLDTDSDDIALRADCRAKFILLILAIVSTVLATLTAIMFCLGMGANSSPAEIRTLKLWMACFSLLGVAGIAVGLFLMRINQPGRAAATAFLPAVVMVIIFLIALLK